MPEIAVRKRSHDEAVQSQRKFFKKTARGKVLKVLRERYLRDDVPCGLSLCSLCDTEQALPSKPLLLESRLGHDSFPNGHFLLPDTNMDLFESQLFSPSIILLQTVMDEVRHRSLPLCNRLKTLVESDEKTTFIFYNEYKKFGFRDTAVVRIDGETPNDLNDRSIREAALWYQNHVKQAYSTVKRKERLPTIVLITEDSANRSKANSQGIRSMSVRQYVEGLQISDKAHLLDLLSAEPEEIEVAHTSELSTKTLYSEYLPMASLVAGVKSGQLYQGYFNANPYNYLEGSVNVLSFHRPVLIIGREHMNRSVHGDVVAIEMLPESEWKSSAEEVIDPEIFDAPSDLLKNDNAEDSEEEVDTTKLQGREETLIMESRDRISLQLQPTGKTSLVNSNNDSLALQTVFATPVSRLLPRIKLRTRQAPTLLGQKILVTLDRWSINSRYPEGHFVRALGQVESKEAEQESLLLEYEVPYRPFGKAILDCLPPEGAQWVVPPKDPHNPAWRDREDLRDLLICSIDPPNCQDIDDALHARLLPNGNIEAGVHIADVSYFVLPENAMDVEAAARSTTVYLVDNRIDMLPSLLGTNLCSLRPNVERLAFSAIWELTPNADVVNVRFTKSVIASKAAFTYEQAQIRKDDPHMQDDLTDSIRLLNSLAQKLKQKRMAAGALNLSSPEVKIHLDSSESSDPIDVEQKEMKETNSLVEEFMLLANISVAKKIQEVFPLTSVLRRHLPPPKGNFEKLQDILQKCKGLSLDVSSSATLAKSLDLCVDSQEPAFNTLVRIMATRCMLSAEYFCSGSVSRDTFGHYGLASPIYTHFTSPIRRYADVLVHRQLAAAINYVPLHPSLQGKAFVERTLENANHRHRMAQMAGRASIEFYVGLALKSRGNKAADQHVQEEAFVIRTFRNGLGVFVSKLGIEGLVTFKRDVKFDPEQYTITIPGSNGKDIVIKIFNKVTVGISVEKDKNTQRGKVKMSLTKPIDSSQI
ncbi:hypothetical protein Clacol_002659 [Clathrus columnatus]|uniref:Ribosomal RNA-processing protein 44 n=1 Tax=Clathrus columnatus TaxID=1419009 RepID=A0AAV5A724_9AGAM|nr:hypothetical protein Clacol_002659 [Clathrus columnatus]